MRTSKLSRIVGLAVLSLAMGLMSGCGIFAQPTPLTPQDTAMHAIELQSAALAVAELTVEDLYATHKIGDATYADLRAAEAIAAAYLEAASTAAETNKPIDAQTQLALFNQSLLKINKAILGTKAPATQPST